MKAVTIQQPWAHLIIHGYFDAQTGAVRRKDVENRVWPCNYRGPLAIHAGKGLDYVKTTPRERFGLKLWDLAFGAIVGVVEMHDCVPLAKCRDSQWAEGPYCHLYREPVAIDPVPAAGKQGLWTLPPELAVVVADLVRRAKGGE